MAGHPLCFVLSVKSVVLSLKFEFRASLAGFFVQPQQVVSAFSPF